MAAIGEADRVIYIATRLLIFSYNADHQNVRTLIRRLSINEISFE